MRTRGIVFLAITCSALLPSFEVRAADAESMGPLETGPLETGPSSYTAQVAVDDANVRSGPGDAYYATARLDRGASVVVYHRDASGWCAIKPPPGSFSWVAARSVRPADDPGLGKIARDETPSRIGSELGKDRHAVQVRLKEGELVEVLGKQTTGDRTWYRIAPPQGEFRWMAERDLESAETSSPVPIDKRDIPIQSVEESKPPTELLPNASTSQLDTRPQSTNPDGPIEVTTAPTWKLAPARELQTIDSRRPQESQVPGMDARGATRVRIPQEIAPPMSEPVAVAAPESWRQSGAPVWRSPGDHAIAPARTEVEDRTVPSRQTASAAPPALPGSNQKAGAFADSLDAVDFQLSRIIAGEPRIGTFDKLRRRATVLLNTATDDAEAAGAQRLLAKIARFEEIQYRQAALTSQDRMRHDSRSRVAHAFPDEPDDAIDSNDVIPMPESARPLSDAGRYDAVGVLKRVGSRRRDAPRFALVDPTGNIVSFVTPSPGLNMQAYLGQRVGVYGTRGFMPEFRRAHVTAARVTPLSNVRR